MIRRKGRVCILMMDSLGIGAAEDAAKTAAKQALLDKLGITAEEAALLLGGTN